MPSLLRGRCLVTATSGRIAAAVETDWDEICRCDGICECGQDDGYDESFYREIDLMDLPDGEVRGG